MGVGDKKLTFKVPLKLLIVSFHDSYTFSTCFLKQHTSNVMVAVLMLPWKHLSTFSESLALCRRRVGQQLSQWVQPVAKWTELLSAKSLKLLCQPWLCQLPNISSLNAKIGMFEKIFCDISKALIYIYILNDKLFLFFSFWNSDLVGSYVCNTFYLSNLFLGHGENEWLDLL